MSVKHTPTPWKITAEHFYEGEHGIDICSSSGGITQLRAWPPDLPRQRANAAYLCLAANAHYELLDTLRRYHEETMLYGGPNTETRKKTMEMLARFQETQ